MKMRFHELSLLTSLALAASCAQEVNPATAIVVSMKTDFDRPAELAAVEIRTFKVGKNPQVDKPSVTFRTSADQLDRPYVLTKSNDDEVLIAVQGFGPANEPIVEYRTQARFESGKSVTLPVVLAEACRGKSCPDGQTCHGSDFFSVSIGACGAVPTPADLQEQTDPTAHVNWDAGFPHANDGGLCTSVPDAGAGRCNPVDPCGCVNGLACRNVSATENLCVTLSPNAKPIGGECVDDLGCNAGLACRRERCVPLCANASDCGTGGVCWKFDEDEEYGDYGTCLKSCTNDAACTPGSSCRKGPEDVPIGTYCQPNHCPEDDRGDGVCDEPVEGGTGICPLGSDRASSGKSDCECAPAAQKYCTADQTCIASRTTGTSWTSSCIVALTAENRAEGAECTAGEQCRRGLNCIDKLCVKYCTPGASASCGVGSQCYTFTNGTAALVPAIGMCRTPCTTNAQCPAGVCMGATATTPGICAGR